MSAAQSQGYNLIFGVGFALHDAVADAAKEHEDVNYVIIDDVIKDQKNVESVLFADNEGAYLAGIAAAMQSKTNKVGFIGGQTSDTITRFEAGFTAGAKSVNQTSMYKFNMLNHSQTLLKVQQLLQLCTLQALT